MKESTWERIAELETDLLPSKEGEIHQVRIEIQDLQIREDELMQELADLETEYQNLINGLDD